MQQGVYLIKDFTDYYANSDYRNFPQEGDSDIAYRDLAQINYANEGGSE